MQQNNSDQLGNLSGFPGFQNFPAGDANSFAQYSLPQGQAYPPWYTLDPQQCRFQPNFHSFGNPQGLDSRYEAYNNYYHNQQDGLTYTYQPNHYVLHGQEQWNATDNTSNTCGATVHQVPQNHMSHERPNQSKHGSNNQARDQQSKYHTRRQQRTHPKDGPCRAKTLKEDVGRKKFDMAKGIVDNQVKETRSSYSQTEKKSFLDYLNSDLLEEEELPPSEDSGKPHPKKVENGKGQQFVSSKNTAVKEKDTAALSKRSETSDSGRIGARQKKSGQLVSVKKDEKKNQERGKKFERPKTESYQSRNQGGKYVYREPKFADEKRSDRERLLQALESGNGTEENKIWDPKPVTSKHTHLKRNQAVEGNGHHLQSRIDRRSSGQGKGSSVQADDSQMGVLIEQLSRGSYECMVCCERIWQAAAVWSCGECYHVFHLKCIRKWSQSASSGTAESSGWRCPACQNISEKVPSVYWCFCGQVSNPVWNRHDTPHSCGEVCNKKRPGVECIHPCTMLCHPGPCPTCNAVVERCCQCKKLKKNMRCGQYAGFQCEEVCNKTLNCGCHMCKIICHPGTCSPCQMSLEQTCHCGKTQREVSCGSQPVDKSTGELLPFVCDKSCNKLLDCNNHTCKVQCHAGPCATCNLLPANQTRCPCGQHLLSELDASRRTSCFDPVPTCDQVCGKVLKCGSGGDRHYCGQLCHEGPCGECSKATKLRCRCGSLEKEVPCKELGMYTGENQLCCEKRCKKKLQCTRHKCNKLCCIEEEHKCEQVCTV